MKHNFVIEEDFLSGVQVAQCECGYTISQSPMPGESELSELERQQFQAKIKKHIDASRSPNT